MHSVSFHLSLCCLHLNSHFVSVIPLTSRMLSTPWLLLCLSRSACDLWLAKACCCCCCCCCKDWGGCCIDPGNVGSDPREVGFVEVKLAAAPLPMAAPPSEWKLSDDKPTCSCWSRGLPEVGNPDVERPMEINWSIFLLGDKRSCYFHSLTAFDIFYLNYTRTITTSTYTLGSGLSLLCLLQYVSLLTQYKTLLTGG